MKHIILLILLCISISSYSQKESNSVLWKISGNGLQETSYLFGTIHSVPEKQFTISDSIKKYLTKSGTLILEIDPNIPLGEQVKLAQRMFLPKGQTIRQYMDSVQYFQMCNYLRDSMKIKEEKIKKYFALKPVFMQSMLLMQCIEKPKTYEVELKDLAGKKKNFIPLETLDEQLNILDSIPMEQQVSFDSNDYKFDKEYYMLLDLYLKQDLSGIDSLMFGDPEFMKIEYNLLTKRNLVWIKKINDSMRKQSTFIAVGCAHLIGENGLIKSLRKDGYTVEPIYF
jgi:uncharacterized protein